MWRSRRTIHPVRWLLVQKNKDVFIEGSTILEDDLDNDPRFTDLLIDERFHTFADGVHGNLTELVDLIICLGGDGTLLYASSLFQDSCPPVLPFHIGSLGFLSTFHIDEYEDAINQLIEGSCFLTLRSRLVCSLIPKLGVPATETPGTYTVLNDLVVHRGPSQYLATFELYLNDKLITTVLSDGLIVSTPTGSTAYAVAAGAPLVHPQVDAMVVTPICPHSLSFRPIVVPAGMELKIIIADDCRNSPWASFDGRSKHEMKPGDGVIMNTTPHSVPCVCKADPSTDWFGSLARCLNWNVQHRQKKLERPFMNGLTPLT